MTKFIRKITEFFEVTDQSPSIEDIAEMMMPVDEDTMQLPRSFAHSVRHILENEAELAEESTDTNVVTAQ